MGEDPYLLQYNMNTFLIELERGKVMKSFIDSRVGVFEFAKRRLALWRLSQENITSFQKVFHSEYMGLGFKELQRSMTVLRYSTEDWTVYDFKKKAVHQLLEEYDRSDLIV